MRVRQTRVAGITVSLHDVIWRQSIEPGSIVKRSLSMNLDLLSKIVLSSAFVVILVSLLFVLLRALQ